jgi:heme exporter protein C
MTWLWFNKLASPPHFYRIAGRWIPWLGWPAALLGITGVVWGLAVAPGDYQQGEGYRIIYVHAPSAWLSTFTYTTMAVSAAIGLIWRMNVAHAVSASCATLGASFTFLALATGSLWGKPMWGTWWEWDPRLTSELLLLFLYLGYLGLRGAIEEQGRADRVCALLAIVGVVNVPIIYYSVEWWNSLHQAPSVMKFGKSSMPGSMLAPLLIMFAAGTLFAATLVLLRARGEILRRERGGNWIAAAIDANAAGAVRP